MSRLAGDNTREIGDASRRVRRHRPQRTAEDDGSRQRAAARAPARRTTTRTGVINNLDGSGGLIKDHSDVTNEAVTYAFASRGRSHVSVVTR